MFAIIKIILIAFVTAPTKITQSKYETIQLTRNHVITFEPPPPPPPISPPPPKWPNWLPPINNNNEDYDGDSS